jgi:hypothetical protein
MGPLASFGNSKSQTNLSHPTEILIPRDPNLIISPMILQNIIPILHNQLFNLQYLNITSIQPISVHFEILPLNASLAYLFITSWTVHKSRDNSMFFYSFNNLRWRFCCFTCTNQLELCFCQC